MNDEIFIMHLRNWYKGKDVDGLSPDDIETELLELIDESIDVQFSR